MVLRAGGVGVEIMDVFQRLNGEGLTIVMVTHEPEMARFASRPVVLRDGLVRTDRDTAPLSAAEARAAKVGDEHTDLAGVTA